jgi:hypothetical protein
MPSVRFGRRVLVPMKAIKMLPSRVSESLQDTQEETGRPFHKHMFFERHNLRVPMPRNQRFADGPRNRFLERPVIASGRQLA